MRLDNGGRKIALEELTDILPSATTRITDFPLDNARGNFGRRSLDRDRWETRPHDAFSSTAFYLDRSPSDAPRENSLYISNLPYDSTEELLIQELSLSSFAVERIDFIGFRNCNALIKFQTAAETGRARIELANRPVLGRSVAVRLGNE